MNHFSKTLHLLFIFLCGTAALAANTITGAVLNQTTGKPAVGDEVVLLRLGQGMQEESRTKTDEQGKFTLNVTSPQDAHIVQVSHQGVNYDQPVSGGATQVDLKVYDAVAKIPGLQGPIGIAQVESDGKALKVTEMYDIVNSSNPPVTQSRPDNYVITVPANAVFDSVQAKRGQGIWVKAVPAPVKGQKGQYSINFPIRPGDTLFRIEYHLPYQGPTTLRLKLPYPIQRFGVMHPPSITFKALRPKTFASPPGLANDLKVEQATVIPLVGDVPAFQVSGVGSAKPHGQESAPAPQQAPAVSAPPSSAPHTTPVPPPSPADQSKKELWLMIGGILLILVVGLFTFWQMNQRKRPAMVSRKQASGTPLLDALKEELFQLESDRLHGSISPEEYASTKEALSKSIERAISKKQQA